MVLHVQEGVGGRDAGGEAAGPGAPSPSTVGASRPGRLAERRRRSAQFSRATRDPGAVGAGRRAKHARQPHRPARGGERVPVVGLVARGDRAAPPRRTARSAPRRRRGTGRRCAASRRRGAGRAAASGSISNPVTRPDCVVPTRARRRAAAARARGPRLPCAWWRCPRRSARARAGTRHGPAGGGGAARPPAARRARSAVRRRAPARGSSVNRLRPVGSTSARPRVGAPAGPGGTKRPSSAAKRPARSDEADASSAVVGRPGSRDSQRLAPRPGRVAAEHVQAVADLRVLHVAQIGVEAGEPVVVGQRPAAAPLSASEAGGLAPARGSRAASSALRRAVHAVGRRIFVDQPLQLGAPRRASPAVAERRGEVADRDRAEPALRRGGLAGIVGDERIDHRQAADAAAPESRRARARPPCRAAIPACRGRPDARSRATPTTCRSQRWNAT